MKISTSNIPGVKEFVDLCYQQGLEYVVVSPGSRNAPLSICFARHPHIKTIVIVDERSAAYFALGMIQKLQKPVAVLCTSGTALLNYGPAVAEAYYQRLPLLVFSADRPLSWIDQDDSQAIDQPDVFRNFVKKSYSLPLSASSVDDLWFQNRIVNEAFVLANSRRKGPVHINVPLQEPLYDLAVQNVNKQRVIRRIEPADALSDEDLGLLSQMISGNKKVLILVGLLPKSSKLNDALSKLAKFSNIVVLSETVSNISDANFIDCIDRVISTFAEDEKEAFSPDILISLGGPLISKMIKGFLKAHKPKEHCLVGIDDKIIDTFQSLTAHINISPDSFFASLNISDSIESDYASLWQKRNIAVASKHNEYIDSAAWSDLKVFDYLLKRIPANSDLQSSNSSIVRYTQLFNTNKSLTYYANRGTSGIDGSSSTAVGSAWVSDNETVLITGDISFFYDSNALWNNYLSKKLKIILVNNGGGGIFRFIPGPSGVDELEKYFETSHNLKANSIAESFSIPYFYAEKEEDLPQKLNELFASDSCSILEIMTPRTLNDKVLKDYFKNIKV